MDDELFNRALQELDAEMPDVEASPAQPDQQPPPQEKSLLDRGVEAWQSVGAGIAKAGIETKDFIFGEPEESEKSELRRGIERKASDLAASSTLNSVTMGVSQIVTGLIGAGKIMAPIKVLKASRTGAAAFETARGAVAGAVAIDPHEERLSNLIEDYPSLQNPVTEYLAADPEDSAAEGRFKNALESIGVDLALVGAIKVIKLMRSGDQEAALKEIRRLESSKAEQDAAFKRNQNEFGLDFNAPQETPRPDFRRDFAPKTETAPNVDPQDATGGSPSGVGGDMVPTPDGPPRGAPDDPGLGGGGAAPASAPPQDVIEQLGLRTPLDEAGQRAIPSEVRPDAIRVREVTDDELDAIVKGSEADTQAIAKFGSVEEAAAAGHKFAKGTPLPWQKLRGTVEAMTFIRQTAAVLKSRYDLAKGGAVMSDSRVKGLADELGQTFNEEPAMILGQIAEAGEQATQMVSFMEAALRIGNKMFLEADDLAKRIRLGQVDDFMGNLEAAQAELKARVAATVDVMAAANSMLSNSGRALRRARTKFRISAADLAAIKDMDGDKLSIIMEKANGDPSKVMLLANRSWSQRVMDDATFHMTNGLLWLWPTHLVNTATNLYMLATRPAEKWFGASVARTLTKDPGRRAELTTISRQAQREYTYMIAALGDGWTNAVEAFLRGDSILSPHNTEYFNKGAVGVGSETIVFKPVKNVVDLAQNAWQAATYRNAVGLPTRALGGFDEFFKTIRYRAVVQSRAAVEAADLGLSKADAKAYIQKALDQAIDPATGQALDSRALLEAQTVTFQQDLAYDTTIGGSVGRGIQNVRRTAPITSLVVPFLKTPVNVIRMGIKLTPGLNLVQKEFRDAIMGRAGEEARAQAIGQMAMGSMFSALAAHLYLSGRFTSGGPDDFKLKQELTATGWRPYSYVWEDEEGNTKYFQVGRFDPAGQAMGLIADVIDMMAKHPERSWDQAIASIAVAVAKNLGEKTFLLNFNSAIDAMSDPEKLLPKYVGRTLNSMIPFSSALRGYVNPDPYLREARTLVDSLKRGMPGLSETLPKAFTVFGEPIEIAAPLVGTQTPDILEAEHNRIILQTDRGLGKPDPQFEGVDLRDLRLEKTGQNAYERYQELSGHIPGQPKLRDILEGIIKSDTYQDLPDGEAGIKGTRLNALSTTVSDYRQAAKRYLMMENPDLQKYFKARQRAARGAFLENRAKKQEPGARELLKSLGGN